MHAQVIRAVHRVHVPEHGEHLADRALRGADRVGLVSPQRRAAEPVAAYRQRRQRGHGDDQPVRPAMPGRPPGTAALAGAMPAVRGETSFPGMPASLWKELLSKPSHDGRMPAAGQPVMAAERPGAGHRGSAAGRWLLD